MKLIVRLGFLLAILGGLFWGDVVAFLELSAAKDRPAVRESSEVAEPAPAPQREVRDARREFERLRRENLADAEAEARWRTSENEAADREAEFEDQR